MRWFIIVIESIAGLKVQLAEIAQLITRLEKCSIGSRIHREETPMMTNSKSCLLKPGILLLVSFAAACGDNSGGSASGSGGAAGSSSGGTAAGGSGGTAATGSGGVTSDLPVNLGTAVNYVILAKSGISTVPTSAVTGNLGVSPAARDLHHGIFVDRGSNNVFSTSRRSPGRCTRPTTRRRLHPT